MDKQFQDIHYGDGRHEELVIRCVMIKSIYFDNDRIRITYKRPGYELNEFHIFIPIKRGYNLTID